MWVLKRISIGRHQLKITQPLCIKIIVLCANLAIRLRKVETGLSTMERRMMCRRRVTRTQLLQNKTLVINRIIIIMLGLLLKFRINKIRKHRSHFKLKHLQVSTHVWKSLYKTQNKPTLLVNLQPQLHQVSSNITITTTIINISITTSTITSIKWSSNDMLKTRLSFQIRSIPKAWCSRPRSADLSQSNDSQASTATGKTFNLSWVSIN